MSIYFNGQLIESPAVASRVDDSAMAVQSATLGQALALVGKSAGGKPNTALRFRTPGDAKAALVSGELLDAVLRAFNPSNDTGAPDSITAVRVDPATQSTLQLRDGAAAVVITLTSTGYGLRENQLKAKVEAATGGRGRKLTVQRGNDYYSADDVFRNAFKIRYSGAQASGVMTISGSTVTLQAPSGTPVATIALASYPTVQALVDRINAVADFSASVQDGSDAKATVQALDFVTAQDVKTADYIAKADLQAVVDWFNGVGEGFVNAVREPDVGTLPANLAFTYLSGATDGSVTNTEWSNAFTVLQAEDVQWALPVNGTAAIHAMAVAHNAYMSNVARKERRGIYGTDLGVNDATALPLAKVFGSDRGGFVNNGGYDFDENGVLKLYPPYIVAAMIAGAFCGVTPGTPMTAKSLRLQGLERKLRNPTDTDPLLRGGIIPLEIADDGQVRVVQSISTWLTDTKLNRRELSCGVAVDFTCRTVRRALDPIKGSKGGPTVLGLAISNAKSALAELSRTEAQGGLGVLVGDADNPPFRNITARMVGDQVALRFECSPASPVNYVTAEIFVKPYSGSASA